MSARPHSQAMPSRRLFLGAAAATTAALATDLSLGTRSAHAADSAYVMGYFTESPNGLGTDYGLHLAVSTDSLNWTPLNQNNPVVTPTAGAGGLRDPFIMRKRDGGFVVLATDLKGTDWGYNSQTIHVWDSTDLRTFTNYRRPHLHDMVTHSWAPEAFWDASRGQYAIIYSSVNNSGHSVLMVNYTSDFTTVSASQVFFDPGYDIIDGDMAVGVNGVNYLYFKSSSTGGLVGARSTTLNPGSFTPFSTSVAHGGTEAPTLVKSLTSNTWYLWGDTYTPNGVFYAWRTTDLAVGTWTPVDQKLYTHPVNAKHCTIAPITAAEYTNLLARWGAPAWNRLKSYNYPARYVRHADYLARIDTYPFDPYTDSQWKLVPGLADSSGISFQSVNYPTRHLRHYDYALRLDANDGTTAFAQDATFHRVAGLADASWSSFRSHNHPTRYIRHSDYALRVDPITTATDRADATFSVGH
ncbi:glycoside hydrolase family 43 protein [Streptomyces sp. NPDC057239]|uniref:glycoside hydrolase family 43 protein n=1 Tax=Streptomyces sp. NPDC057239 TaxID=3346061 RepID=UPI0036372A8F